MSGGEQRHGVNLTSLDQEMFTDAGATKRDLIDYLDAVADVMLPGLANRPLSVLRVRPGQQPFMQKNVPKYTPDWVRTVQLWAGSSRREISYAVCDDRPTLIWFGNQRAVEYHPTLTTVDGGNSTSFLIMDIDPPPGADFSVAVAAARLVRQALADVGMSGAVKTSGAKGVHIFVPVTGAASIEEVAAATRALAVRAERLDPELATTAYLLEDRGGKVFLDSTRGGGATVVAAYSPRIRPGLPVSFPVAWDDLDRIRPGDFTVHTAPSLLSAGPSWPDLLPAPQDVHPDLITEGHEIPVARVIAMHEGKRRARAREAAATAANDDTPPTPAPTEN